ncbi:hypothetical protein [Pseudorhizobium marinum]|nr:hypothetical protein [Pseudorhizobium marinum]
MIQDEQTAPEAENRAIEDSKIEFFDPWQQAFQEETGRREQEFEF